MAATHRYTAAASWSGSTAGGYRAYDRAHRVTTPPAATELAVSADPSFKGDPALFNPEQLLLTAAVSCQLLSFLALAARAGVDVVRYDDDAEAFMPATRDRMRITRIGGPTALVEWQGWRILTDPTFDPPGRTYSFGLGTSSRKTIGPGEGPGGSHLYNAEWYRRPSHAEIAGYMPPGGVPAGAWAEIACRTIPGNQVENCRSLGESPVGSGLARGLRLAAWQFRVLPPRVDGRPLIGAWVRIHLDFTDKAKSDRVGFFEFMNG